MSRLFSTVANKQHVVLLFLIRYSRMANIGVGDRTRTCIIRICNPLPNHSVTHPHCLVPRPRIELGWTNYLLLTGYKSAVLPLNYRGIGRVSGSRTLWPTFVSLRISNPLHYHPAHTRYLAGAVRFELTDPFEPLVFKTSAIDHSTTLPYRNILLNLSSAFSRYLPY